MSFLEGRSGLAAPSSIKIHSIGARNRHAAVVEQQLALQSRWQRQRNCIPQLAASYQNLAQRTFSIKTKKNYHSKKLILL